jgi:outer membrane protein assembly factor BamA
VAGVLEPFPIKPRAVDTELRHKPTTDAASREAQASCRCNRTSKAVRPRRSASGWPAACSCRAVHRRSVGLLTRAVVWASLSLLSAFLLGCTSAPAQRFNLESLKVTGNSHVDEDEITERIASRETPKFLGLFSGILYDYEVFNRFVLERDLQRVERYYRARGYYQAHARAAHVFRSGSKVRVEIVVEEGEPVLLRRVDIYGIDKLPKDLQIKARAAVTGELPLGEPLEEAKLDEASKALAALLGDTGYARAIVRKSADVTLPLNFAAAGFWVTAGEPSEIGEVKLEGLADLPEDKVRRALDLQPGMAYSQSELDESKRALLDLGVFGSVEIEPQVDAATPGPNGKPRIPILVKLEKAKLRSVHLGGGVQIDSLKSDVHLTAGWEDQSFLGGMRKLQFDVTPGVVVYPTRFPTFETPQRLLPEGRFRTEFRQPGFITGRTSLVLKGQVAAYPLLPPGERDPKAPIVGYFDYRASAGLERTYYKLYTYLSQNVQVNVPFYYFVNDEKDRDAALKPVVASYPALTSTLDFRDDRIHPHRGIYIGNELQVAGLGGQARDLKIQPEIRAYVPVSRRVTLASRASFGLLFAQNYGRTVETNALEGAPPPDADEVGRRENWVKDIQLMFMRGLFAGGSGSNRGYPLRGIGPHGAVPFYNHGQSMSPTTSGNADSDYKITNDYCRTVGKDADGNVPKDARSVCDLPLGGFTLWELSVELRFPLTGGLSGTIFTDAADVSARRLSFRWRPHLSSGFGLRYDTPVGPVRFDLGFRLPGLQAPKGAADEPAPLANFLGLPVAASFGIGESY